MSRAASGLESAFRRTHDLLKRSRTGHLFVGGLAVMVAAEPRMTRDVDLIVFITKKRLPGFLRLAANKGFSVDERKAYAEAIGRGACSIGWRGVPIDLILASTDLEDSAWKRRRRCRIFGRTVNIPSNEDLILLKLIPGRPKDLLDVHGIVKSAGPALDRSYLRSWAEKLCDRAEDMRLMRLLEETGAIRGARRTGRSIRRVTTT